MAQLFTLVKAPRKPHEWGMKRPLEIYARFFENVTPRTVGDLRMLVAPDVRFSDPFNEVTGADKLVAVFEKMYAELENPKVKVHGTAMGAGDKIGYMRWTLTYKRGMRVGKFDGMSEITFGKDGKVASHVNFWDSGRQFLGRLPMVGTIVRMIMGKAGVS